MTQPAFEFGPNSPSSAGSITLSVAAASTEVPSGTGDTHVLSVGDLVVATTWATDPLVEDIATTFTVTLTPSNLASTTNSVTVTLDTGVTTSSPGTSSNAGGWTIGSWTAPGGGTQWSMTMTKASIAANTATTAVFSTTPSAAGTLTLAATASNANSFAATSNDALTVTAAASWTVDATSSIAIPADATEAAALLTAGGGSGSILGLWRFGTAASGNITDDSGNSKTLTASGTWSYQQAVSGWSATALKSTSGTAARVLNTSFSNVNANSYTLFLFALTSAEAATRTIVRMGDVFDDDATMEITSAEKLNVGEGNGSRSVSTNTIDGSVRPYVLRIDDSANQVDGFIDIEKIVGGTQTCNGTELCFGGNNSQTWMPGGTSYIWAMLVSGALTDQVIRDTLEAAGVTVSGYGT